MDEPTEGSGAGPGRSLDRGAGAVRDDSELSIILVEQNSRVALTFSPRTVILDKGRIVYDGESEPLRADPDRLANSSASSSDALRLLQSFALVNVSAQAIMRNTCLIVWRLIKKFGRRHANNGRI